METIRQYQKEISKRNLQAQDIARQKKISGPLVGAIKRILVRTSQEELMKQLEGKLGISCRNTIKELDPANLPSKAKTKLKTKKVYKKGKGLVDVICGASVG